MCLRLRLRRHKWNTVAVVSDGTRVLGLGDIGPEAGLPVMEGKALLFKYLGGVDAFPIMLKTKDPHEFIRTVKILEPTFGGINLEDIAQPKCFHILDTLRKEMNIPVWHDDQQGTASVELAGTISALRLVGKKMSEAKVAIIGTGAANIAFVRILIAAGIPAKHIVMVDSKGTLHPGRKDLEEKKDSNPYKWKYALETNGEGIVGGIVAVVTAAIFPPLAPLLAFLANMWVIKTVFDTGWLKAFLAWILSAIIAGLVFGLLALLGLFTIGTLASL